MGIRLSETKVETVLRLARSGVLRAKDLDEVGIPRAYLSRLCVRGELERIGRGLYRIPDADLTENSQLAEVQRRVPQGVVALLTALQFHGLTTQVPHEVWILVPTRSRSPKQDYPPLRLARAQTEILAFGVEEHVIDGTTVRLTSPAKTVADCFRYRRLVGQDVAIEGLRDYLAKYRDGLTQLVEAATVDKVLSVMRPYLEALV